MLSRLQQGLERLYRIDTRVRVDDFVIESTDNLLHVLNAPSPAATAAFAIGESIANRL